MNRFMIAGRGSRPILGERLQSIKAGERQLPCRGWPGNAHARAVIPHNRVMERARLAANRCPNKRKCSAWSGTNKLLACRLSPLFPQPAGPDTVLNAIRTVVVQPDQLRITIDTAEYTTEPSWANMLLDRAQRYIDVKARLDAGKLMLAIAIPAGRKGGIINADIHPSTEMNNARC